MTNSSVDHFQYHTQGRKGLVSLTVSRMVSLTVSRMGSVIC